MSEMLCTCLFLNLGICKNPRNPSLKTVNGECGALEEGNYPVYKNKLCFGIGKKSATAVLKMNLSNNELNTVRVEAICLK